MLQVISGLEHHTIPNMFGNPNPGIPAFLSAIEYMSRQITRWCNWQPVRGQKMLPPALVRELQVIQASLEELAPDKQALQDHIEAITSARAVADNLPETMQRLTQTDAKISKILAAAAENNGRISDATDRSKLLVDEMDKQALQAKKLIEQCEAAYRTTTTTGLAAAFDERAGKLNWSIRWWVVLLVVALVAGATVGYLRVEQLTSALNEAKPDWGVIWAKAVLSVLSVGAPLWLAWLATKQIGQRFRLAEDYAFKASVAKAYEGYRREAAKIDDAFVSRLFGSALTRLEEAPLRFVENETHSSPMQEFVHTSEFREAISKVPGFGDVYGRIFKKPEVKKEAKKPDLHLVEDGEGKKAEPDTA